MVHEYGNWGNLFNTSTLLVTSSENIALLTMRRFLQKLPQGEMEMAL